MPQASAPSILNLLPLPKGKRPKNLPQYDPSNDPRPKFNLSFPLESSRAAVRHLDMSESNPDRDFVSPSPRAPGRQTKSTDHPIRNMNFGSSGSPIRSKDLDPLLRSAAEKEIYRELNFPTSQYQQSLYSSSMIIEAGSTYLFGR